MAVWLIHPEGHVGRSVPHRAAAVAAAMQARPARPTARLEPGLTTACGPPASRECEVVDTTAAPGQSSS
jgi:hypothetical protein